VNILLVEDVADLADAVRAHLTGLGYVVQWCANGNTALEALQETTFDLVILDIMLPGRDGFGVLRDMRRMRNKTPVLVTTARAEIDDKVSLLDLGADDYIVKPYDMREFTARIRALLRRQGGERVAVHVFGKFSYDTVKREASVDGIILDISRRERQLLSLLVSKFGTTIDRERLLERIFADEDGVAPNALEVLVSRMRKKLDQSGLDIVTIRGVGYVLRESRS
jgi:two-component system, OmpR family, response regulator TctD